MFEAIQVQEEHGNLVLVTLRKSNRLSNPVIQE
jgi:hypothetical protein